MSGFCHVSVMRANAADWHGFHTLGAPTQYAPMTSLELLSESVRFGILASRVFEGTPKRGLQRKSHSCRLVLMCSECVRLAARARRLEQALAVTTFRMNAVATSSDRNADYMVLRIKADRTQNELQLLTADLLRHQEICLSWRGGAPPNVA